MRCRVDHERGLIAVYVTEPDHINWLNNRDPIKVETHTTGGYLFLLRLSDYLIEELCQRGLDYREVAPFYRWSAPLVEGKYLAMPHQRDTAAFLTLHERAYVTSTMRTGKTASVVLALEYLRTHVDQGAALIVCPVSVMMGVWGNTLTTMTPGPVALLRGSRPERLKGLGINARYLIINYHGLKIIEPEIKELIKDKTITKVVIDELTHYGNPETGLWKTANKLFNKDVPVRYLWGLTGTPGANSEAVWGYAMIVNPTKVRWRTKTSWICAVRYKWGQEAWQWKDRPEAGRIINEVLQPNIRFKKEDVLKNLPRVMRSALEVELTKEQRKAYLELRAEAITMLKSGEMVTATQKATLIQKIFQVSLGHVMTKENHAVGLDNSPRIKLLDELIKINPAKTVIFGNYIEANNHLVKSLRALGHTVVKIDGSVIGRKRDEAFFDFQNKAEPKVLVAHAKTTAYGAELAAASQIIFNGPMMSGLHTYLQAIERLSSQKQTADSIQIINVYGTKEEYLFQEGLITGARLADSIADTFNVLVS
jgi:SNF2 family DNA or RNA helicase